MTCWKDLKGIVMELIWWRTLLFFPWAERVTHSVGPEPLKWGLAVPWAWKKKCRGLHRDPYRDLRLGDF